jgi:hypothetical protein
MYLFILYVDFGCLLLAITSFLVKSVFSHVVPSADIKKKLLLDMCYENYRTEPDFRERLTQETEDSRVHTCKSGRCEVYSKCIFVWK